MLAELRSLASRLGIGGLMAIKAVWSPVALGAHALIIDPEGKVLLARHSYMTGWSLPGGGVMRGEAPVDAIVRELKEEIGEVRADRPQLIGVFSRRSGWATNVIVLYRLTNARVVFAPNLEVREIIFADPAEPPHNTSAGTRRRLAELAGNAPPSPYW